LAPTQSAHQGEAKGKVTPWGWILLAALGGGVLVLLAVGVRRRASRDELLKFRTLT
jgi:hypothetical protein